MAGTFTLNMVGVDQRCGTIVRAVLYFEIFSYPLTPDEVFRLSAYREEEKELFRQDLQVLTREGLLFQEKGYLFSSPHPDWISRRLDGNLRADAMLPRARKMSRWIAGFPFVRGIYLSGSISKNYMDENSDVDYFIITRPDRLWIARTFLMAYKKIFLLNSRKYFCLNYFIDEEHLEIRDKNTFTATEMATLIRVWDYPGFLEKNKWCKDYFAQFARQQESMEIRYKPGFIKKSIEFLLDHRGGDMLDRFFMKLTVNFWKRKFHWMDDSVFHSALRSNRHVSKHHPHNFQEKVLHSLNQKLKAFEDRHGIKI